MISYSQTWIFLLILDLHEISSELIKVWSLKAIKVNGVSTLMTISATRLVTVDGIRE
jgi:hypothetical protein